MLEVIGVGFGRTGTLSLKLALEALGYRRCYHFTEMLKLRHARKWLRIADADRPDWTSVFAGYRATTDWPGAAFWRELSAAYPEAKLILTVRDADDWYDSTRQTIRWLSKAVPRRLWGFRDIADVADRIIWDGVFRGRADDRDYAIERFRSHIDEVQQVIPADRLLVFDVREGWGPLCRFLGVALPQSTPFPHRNDRKTMRRKIRFVLLLRYLLPAAAVIAALSAGWVALAG